jgi:hypothetical protein
MSDDLQFEKAEYADPSTAAACAGCQRGLSGTYYAVGDQILCPSCAESLRARLADQGSRAGRIVRATGAGLGAAALGSLLYYAIIALTGYELGLIAIVVGYGVGVAVRWGSYGRGGWRYQGLAMALTYLSIVTAYVPPILQGLRANIETSVTDIRFDVLGPDSGGLVIIGSGGASGRRTDSRPAFAWTAFCDRARLRCAVSLRNRERHRGVDHRHRSLLRVEAQSAAIG